MSSFYRILISLLLVVAIVATCLSIVATVHAYSYSKHFRGLLIVPSLSIPRVVLLSSNPYERGYEYGLQVGNLITANVIIVQKLLGYRLAEVLDEALEWAKELPDEIRLKLMGIAKGAGLSFDDIVLLNYVAQFVYGEECTAAVISAEASALGVPLLWKNRDLGTRWGQHQVILVVNDGNGYRFIAVTTAGYWGIAMGVNEKGFGVVDTYIPVKYRPKIHRWGNLDLMRLMLYKLSKVDEVYGFLNATTGKYSGSSFLVIDPEEAAVIDMASDAMQAVTYAKNFIVRTDHWEPIAPKEAWPYERYKG